MTTTANDARAAGVDSNWIDSFAAALQTTAALTIELATRGQQGDPAFMLRHSTDFLDLFSTVVIAWQWLRQAAVAARALPNTTPADRGFYEGKLCAAQYWLTTELPRVDHLATLCRTGEDSYARMQPEWF